MKLLYELEDSIVGIITGILMFVYLGAVNLEIPYFEIVFPVVLGIFLLMNFLDVIYFARDLHENLKLSLVSFVINIADIVINLAFLSKLLSIKIPFISERIVPFITNDTIPVIASYLIFVNFVWIYWYHKK